MTAAWPFKHCSIESANNPQTVERLPLAKYCGQTLFSISGEILCCAQQTRKAHQISRFYHLSQLLPLIMIFRGRRFKYIWNLIHSASETLGEIFQIRDTPSFEDHILGKFHRKCIDRYLIKSRLRTQHLQNDRREVTIHIFRISRTRSLVLCVVTGVYYRSLCARG